MKLKLVSRKDTLLGHIDVPDHWAKWLKRGEAAQTVIMPRTSLRWIESQEITAPVVKKLTLVNARWSQYRDAVFLMEGTIEELERQPECSFTPSMAYLRSVLTND